MPFVWNLPYCINSFREKSFPENYIMNSLLRKNIDSENENSRDITITESLDFQFEFPYS